MLAPCVISETVCGQPHCIFRSRLQRFSPETSQNSAGVSRSLMRTRAFRDCVGTLFACGEQASGRPGVIHCGDLSCGHNNVDVAEPARTYGGAAIAIITCAGDRHSVSGIVGPDFRFSLTRAIYRRPHASENLLFRHANHGALRFLSNLCALKCTAAKRKSSAERHHRQNSHFERPRANTPNFGNPAIRL